MSDSSNGAKVLLVEDNEDELEIYTSMLYYNNFDVVQATNAYEAIEAAWSNAPDVVLMDISLPGINGLSAIDILKANPLSSSIPIICFTAYGIPREEVLARGCADLLDKPVQAGAMVAALLRVLEPPQGRSRMPP
jgi:two-component system, cell cycle response regulator DivK